MWGINFNSLAMKKLLLASTVFLFFTFSEEDKIDLLLKELEILNARIESENPLKAIVLNIEKFQ